MTLSLHALRCEHFRNLANAHHTFHPHLNLIRGANGAGKTALLEALYLLGRGKSFRESQTRHIIAHGEAQLRLVATLMHGNDVQQLGLEKSAR